MKYLFTFLFLTINISSTFGQNDINFDMIVELSHTVPTDAVRFLETRGFSQVETDDNEYYIFTKVSKDEGKEESITLEPRKEIGRNNVVFLTNDYALIGSAIMRYSNRYLDYYIREETKSKISFRVTREIRIKPYRVWVTFLGNHTTEEYGISVLHE